MSFDVTIGVLALQGDVREHVASLEAVGARAVPVRREAELDTVDGLVIPGGESTAMWKLAAAFELFDPLRKRLAGGMPAYGSCAGMIMLADRVLDAAAGQETFGGIDITVRRNAFGRQVDSFEEPISTSPAVEDGAGARAVFIRAPVGAEAGPKRRRRWRARSGGPPVGSSRFGRARCWPRRSTRS